VITIPPYPEEPCIEEEELDGAETLEAAGDKPGSI
jgi:hypothetical protein